MSGGGARRLSETVYSARMVDAIREILGIAPLYASDRPDPLSDHRRLHAQIPPRAGWTVQVGSYSRPRQTPGTV